MLSEMLKLKFDCKEAFLLFKLMGIHSFIGYTNPFEHMESLEIEKELLRVKNTLLFNGILIEQKGYLTIEPSTFSFLQACKLSHNIAWLHLDKKNNKKADSYFYISSRQVIEVVENLNANPSTIEFNLIGNHEDFFNELEDCFEELTFINNVSQPNKVNISREAYMQLLNSYDLLFEDELVEKFIQQEKVPNPFAIDFIHSFINYSTIGQLVFINKTNGMNRGIRFVLSDNCQWILTEHPEDEDRLVVENVSSIEFLENLFETYVQSFIYQRVGMN